MVLNSGDSKISKVHGFTGSQASFFAIGKPDYPGHALTGKVRQIALSYSPVDGEALRWQAEALQALQTAAEDYLTHLFEDAYINH